MTLTVLEFDKMYENGNYLSLEDIYIKLNLSKEKQNILSEYCMKVPDLEKMIRSKYARQGFPDNFAKDLSEKLIVFSSIEQLDDNKKINYLKDIFKLNKLFPTKEGEIIRAHGFIYMRPNFQTMFQDLMYEFELMCRFKEQGWEIIDIEPTTSNLGNAKSEFMAEKDGYVIHVEAKKLDRRKVWEKMTGEPSTTKQKSFEQNRNDYDNWEKKMIDKDQPFEIHDLEGIMDTIKRQIKAAASKFDSTSNPYVIYVNGDYLTTRPEVRKKNDEFLEESAFFDKNEKCVAVIFEEATIEQTGIALSPNAILTHDQIPIRVKPS